MVRIDKNSSRAYYEQLVLGIKEDILHGVLQPGDKNGEAIINESQYHQ